MSYQHYILIEEAHKGQNDSEHFPDAHIEHHNVAPSKLIDVTDFFNDITEEYLKLEEMALAIIDQIPNSSPEDLLADSKKLWQRKRNLVNKDEHLLSIVSLAGQELANTPLIHDYRVAFAKATMSCNNLYQRLKALQAEILHKNLNIL